MTTQNPEPLAVQDDPPDLHQALVVAGVLLGDVREHLLRRQGDPEDLALRCDALAAVLGRLRDAREDQGHGG